MTFFYDYLVRSTKTFPTVYYAAVHYFLALLETRAKVSNEAPDDNARRARIVCCKRKRKRQG